MTHFPQDIFNNILSYCDDTVERKQKKIMKQICNDLSAVYIDSYLYGSDYIKLCEEEGFYCLDEYTPVKFCFTDKTYTYQEIGISWLIKQFHGEELDCWEDWTYFRTY